MKARLSLMAFLVAALTCSVAPAQQSPAPPSASTGMGMQDTKAVVEVRMGKKLAALLRDHILIATEVVKAAKAGNKQQLADAQKKWSANGKDIATFLSGANSNWAQADLEQMLQKHLNLTNGRGRREAQEGLGGRHKVV